MKNVILFLCLCGASILHAQQFNVKLSEPVKFDKESILCHRYDKHIISTKIDIEASQLAYTANLKKANYLVEITQYDEQLRELKTISLDSGRKILAPFKPVMNYGEGAIYVLYTKFTAEDKLGMHIATINPHDLTIMANKEIASYDQKNKHFMFGYLNTLENTALHLSVSGNGNYAWVSVVGPKMMVSAIVDGDLNMVQEPKSIPIDQKGFQVTGMQITNDGSTLMTYKEQFSDNINNFGFGLFIQPFQGKHSFQNIKIGAERVASDPDILQSQDGQTIYLGGEYWINPQKKKSEGIYVAQIDIQQKSIIRHQLYPYTEEIRQRVDDLGYSRKNGDFIDQGLLYRMYELSNGTLVLSADMHVTYTSNNTVFYNTGPIIFAFIKPDGKSTMTLIPKLQRRDIFTTYYNFVLEDKLLCFYSDKPQHHKSVYKDKQIEMENNSRDLVPVVSVFNSDGKILQSKMLIDDTDKMEGNVMIGATSYLGNYQFIMPIGKVTAGAMRYRTRIRQLCFLNIL